MTVRVSDSVRRGATVTLRLNGRTITAYEGETLASVILLSGEPACRLDPMGRPRAPFCNMGVCYDCLVSVTDPAAQNRPLMVRACMTCVKDGLVVETGPATGSGHD